MQAQREFESIVDGLTRNGHGVCSDHYLVCHDFPSYCDAQSRVDEVYKDRPKWLSLSIQASACSGKFSTDRTIAEYANKIWNLHPMERPAPGVTSLTRTPSKEGSISPLTTPTLPKSKPKEQSPQVLVESPRRAKKGIPKAA